MNTISGFDKVLYRLALAAIVLAAGSIVWSTMAQQPPVQYAPGDRFEGVAGLDLTAAPTTLVLWVSSRCGACTASMPFYKRLASEPHRTRLVMMGQEPTEMLAAYAKAFDVAPAQIISAGETPLKFSGTPTLLLVGADHVVRSTWYGRRQNAAEELEIFRRLE